MTFSIWEPLGYKDAINLSIWVEAGTMRTCENMPMTVCHGRGGHCASPLQTMNSAQPQTPTCPQIDLSCSKGTPRHWKTPNHYWNPGIKPVKRSIPVFHKELKRILKFSFTPEEWQAHLIQQVQQGYDSIFGPSTGYSKGLVFEGIATLGGQRKVTIVLSPLNLCRKTRWVSFPNHILNYTDQ